MVKLDFHQDGGMTAVASNLSVKFESRNPYRATYQSIMSSFFLVATIINAISWAIYLYEVDGSGLGHV